MRDKIGRDQKIFAGLVFSISIATCFGAPTADAIPMLRLTSGAESVTITDEGGGDAASGTPGVVGFAGGVGTFTLNLTTGFTTPVLGSPTEPWMDILSGDLSGGAGTLTIELTETDFTTPTPVGHFLTSIGGTSFRPDTLIQVQTYLDTANTPFGLGTPLGNTGSILTGADLAFAGASGGGGVPTSSPYALTSVVTLAHFGPTFSSFDAQLKIDPAPEPSSWLLLGSGVVALGCYQRRRTRVLTASSPPA
jgi:hypothetical protein